MSVIYEKDISIITYIITKGILFNCNQLFSSSSIGVMYFNRYNKMRKLLPNNNFFQFSSGRSMSFGVGTVCGVGQGNDGNRFGLCI